MRGSATLAIVVSSADMTDASMTETVMSVRRAPSTSAVGATALLNATPCRLKRVRSRPPASAHAYAHRQPHRHLGLPARETLPRIPAAADELELAGRLSPNCRSRSPAAVERTANRYWDLRW